MRRFQDRFLLISRRKQASIDRALGVLKGPVFFVLAPSEALELLTEREGDFDSLFPVTVINQSVNKYQSPVK